MPLQNGSRLGHFEILNPIGAGGMGEVYRARDDRLGREVAIKILPNDLASNEHALQRFEREAKSVAALSHPNIVALYELDRDHASGVTFFATELLEGETLRGKLRHSTLGWKKAAEIGAAIADGLAAAHAKGILHRDLKPENLFVTHDGQIKILDFGLARSASDSDPKAENISETVEQVTKKGVIVGTAAYMSPEQIRGDPLNSTTDIFSLGCILFEMITGTHPFRRGSSGETMAAILHDDPAPFEISGIVAPMELEWIIQHCLDKRADQRFQSARDVAFDLRRVDSTSSSSRAATTAFDSIAVLPFENESRDPDAEYLSDGITETIISKLSQIPNLQVMARSTVFRYKKQAVDPQEVGKALKVRLVLHGRVSQRGDALLVRTELIKVADGTQIWGERYHKKSADLFEIEEEIAREISEKLRIRLSGDEKQLLVRRHTEDPEVYQAYLKGRFELNKRSEAGLNASLGWFKAALEKDSSYALAYAGLADSYNLLGYFSFLPPAEAFIKSENAVRRALELDDHLAEAYTSRGYVNIYYWWKWDDAERDFRRAIELKASYPIAHHYYMNLLAIRGRFEEALTENRRALDLDPLSLIINGSRGWTHFFRRDYPTAITELRKAVALDETFAVAHVWLSWALVKSGHRAEAIAEGERAAAIAGKGDAVGSLSYVLAAAGEHARATAQLDEMLEASRKRFVQPYYIVLTLAALGRTDEALQWLRKALEVRSHFLVLLRVDPRIDALRDRPEFAEIATEVGV